MSENKAELQNYREEHLTYEPYTMAMGPQHPATHGVLKLDLDLDGEIVKDCRATVGYLHRGVEKLGENMSYAQSLSLTDRLDYVASIANNVAYSVAVETLLGIEAPPRAKYIRTMVMEMGRLTGHLLWLATHALDIGAMTVFLYCFREREQLLDLFEEICGARLTTTYTCIGGVRQDITGHFLETLHRFTDEFPSRIAEYETLIDKNRIWLKRTVGVGVVSAEDAVSLGITGPSLRAAGVDYDIRKHMPYDAYPHVDFEVPIGSNGDVYDRYRCRMEEMHQSNSIIRQCIEALPSGPVKAEDAPDLVMPYAQKKVEADATFSSGLIKLVQDSEHYMDGDVYVAAEVPKGELGFYFVSDGRGIPYRMRIRSPSYIHIGSIPYLSRGQMIADVIAIIGSFDVVLGECDR